MISFIFRFAFFSFLGMLLNPGQLAHQLPTHKQIVGFERAVEKEGGLQHMAYAKIKLVRKDIKQISTTVNDIEHAYVTIHSDLSHTHKDIGRLAKLDGSSAF
jgi:hypothetical protein